MTQHDHPPRVFFVHVMKTGGTSLGLALRARYAADEFYPSGETVRRQKIFVNELLELDAEARARIRCFSVHMPAWLAADVAPGHLRFTVLREPVERVMSHLRHIARIDSCPDDIEAIYDDPDWRGCLTNYQTRVFGETRQDHDRSLATGRRKLAEVGPDEAAALFRRGVRLTWTTAFPGPREMGPTDLARAVRTIESMDEIGVTERIDLFAEHLGRRLGGSLGELGRHNESQPEDPHRFEGLRARVHADNALDLELYERARELALGDR